MLDLLLEAQHLELVLALLRLHFLFQRPQLHLQTLGVRLVLGLPRREGGLGRSRIRLGSPGWRFVWQGVRERRVPPLLLRKLRQLLVFDAARALLALGPQSRTWRLGLLCWVVLLALHRRDIVRFKLKRRPDGIGHELWVQVGVRKVEDDLRVVIRLERVRGGLALPVPPVEHSAAIWKLGSVAIVFLVRSSLQVLQFSLTSKVGKTLRIVLELQFLLGAVNLSFPACMACSEQVAAVLA